MLAANPPTGALAFTTIPVRVPTSRPAASSSSGPAPSSPTSARLPSMASSSNRHCPSPHDSGFSPSLKSRTTPSPTSPAFTTPTSTPPTSLSPSPSTPTALCIATAFTSPTHTHQSTPSNSTISSNSDDWKSCKSTLPPTELPARSAVALPCVYDPEQQRPREARKHIALNEPQEKPMTPDEGPVARRRTPGPYIVAESSAEMMAKRSEEARGHVQAEPTSWWAYFYTSSENRASVVRRGEGSVPIAGTGEKGVQKREKKAGWKKGCGLGGCFGKNK